MYKNKNPVFQSRENRETPPLKRRLPFYWQSYLQLFIYDTCYPCRVSPSSILCASRNQFSPVRVVRKDLVYPGHLLSGFVRIYFRCELRSRFYTGHCFTPVRVFSTLRVPTTPLTEWSRGESNPCAVRISIQYQQYQSYLSCSIS
jgi:hypothetical protein